MPQLTKNAKLLAQTVAKHAFDEEIDDLYAALETLGQEFVDVFDLMGSVHYHGDRIDTMSIDDLNKVISFAYSTSEHNKILNAVDLINEVNDQISSFAYEA